MPEDKFVTFSSNLIKCFKSKVKNSPSKIRTDTLIEVYRNAEENLRRVRGLHSFSRGVMASVDAFLGNCKRLQLLILSPSLEQIEDAKKDLEEFELNLDFGSVEDLYLETRREALAERASELGRNLI